MAKARSKLSTEWRKTSVRNTKDVSDIKLNMLLWGGPKVGKTSFARTCPGIFLIAVENGVLTLKDESIEHFPLFTNEYPIFNTVMTIGNELKKDDSVQTIMLDSEQKLSELLTQEIMEENNISAMRTQDWGVLKYRMSAINNMFLQMDKHYIATCGEAIKASREDENDKEATFNLSGGYRDQMPYEFDFVIYMDKEKRGKEYKHYGHSQDKNKRTAAGRVKLPPKMENPSFDEIWGAVQKELKGQEASK